jgi:hypothetical protein
MQAAQEGAMAAWFHLKNDEWHPNPEDRDAHADAFHETVTPQSDLSKLQHVADLAEERKLYGGNGGSAGAPVQSISATWLSWECFTHPPGPRNQPTGSFGYL